MCIMHLMYVYIHENSESDLGIAGSSPVMVGRAPKFLGALKVVPKLVASGSGTKTGPWKKTT